MYIPERIPHENGRDFALRTLKHNIITLELAPGSTVSENQLSAAMGLSRTPVREAISELSSIGIIDVVPQKKSVVSAINFDLIEEARFSRSVMECAVAELCCSMITPAQLAELEKNVSLQRFYLERSSYSDIAELDNSFHEMFFEIAEKTHIYHLIQRFSIHIERVRSLSLRNIKDFNIVLDHEEIVNAIRSNNPTAAHEIMEKHLYRYSFDKDELIAAHPEFF